MSPKLRIPATPEEYKVQLLRLIKRYRPEMKLDEVCKLTGKSPERIYEILGVEVNNDRPLSEQL